MNKIKDLICFEEIKDVIDIDSDLDTNAKKEILVKEFIISKRLKKSILGISENLSRPKHKAIQIIGGYGSGKSHLLGWLVSLLENPELVDFITDNEVQSEFKKCLQRKYAVVQFELQPGVSALSDFFFDRIEDQLDIKHNIQLSKKNQERVEDYKRDIKEILEKVKEKDPQMGFVVIIDEISDFLKQKTKQQINRDIQFLRVLGQVAKTMDFMFIGSMQENVFSNPKYIDEAESFGRVSERFDIITISREDIKTIISNRVLKKTITQRKEIDTLLADYKKLFPPINSDPESYIDLFPIHPYVIHLFMDLPYYEKRGVIQFTMEKVKDILNNDFPEFITYDSVFDEINSKHNKRNLDEIHPIIEVFESLQTKIELIEQRYQKNAIKLVKALAILKLYGKTKNNGAVPQELANELLLTSTTLNSTDMIILILDKIREVTSGQFIKKTENDYFYLDTEGGVDYDEVIKRKMKNLPDGIIDEELLKLLKYQDLINIDQIENYQRVFLDTCHWIDKKSFRMGHFIFDDSSDLVEKGNLDFNLVIKSPYTSKSTISTSNDTGEITLKYNDNFDDVLKKLAATRLLISENYAKTVMLKKYNKFSDLAKKELLNQLINSKIELNGKKRNIKSIIEKEPNNIDEFFHYLKQNLFNSYFNSEYPKYPKFLNQISHENIKGQVETTIYELLQKGEKNLFTNAKNVLSALSLIDIDNNIETSNSLFVKVIINELNDKKGKNVKIEKIITKLSSKPFGLNPEIIELILVVLTYNGKVVMRKKGGGTITSSDLKAIFKSSIDAFDDIPYVTLETEFPIDSLVKLFQVLQLDPGYIRDSNERTKAVQEFRTKAHKIKDKIASIERNLKDIELKPEQLINVNTLRNKYAEIEEFPIEEFLKVKTVNDFKKVDYDDEKINAIKSKLDLMIGINDFLYDYTNFIHTEFLYAKESLNYLINENAIFSEDNIKKLKEIYEECKKTIDNLPFLLDKEKRRILKGKLQQYKRIYIPLYFKRHKRMIGSDVDWSKLEILVKSDRLKRIRDMRIIKCVNPFNLNKLEDKISLVSKAKCISLKDDHLKNNYICKCSFPKNLSGLDDIGSEIINFHKSVEKIEQEWEDEILAEIENNSENIKHLSPKEREIIMNIQKEKKLPEIFEHEIIEALNNLFSELEIKYISSDDILDYIFAESDVLDYTNLSEKFEELKMELLGDSEKKNVRFEKRE